ncbi:type III pantothenate kinase [bacterium]|nr:type III pantothenate kinase [bacterium]MDB4265645.1 type III pantothenate kinase [Akkermansiaceae bacterium]MDB4307399.1 type III pantothenate kinase [Akkermansiaceae bacterium]MDB4319545.1 type III pantothenate kinase [bacterium]MDB4692022.1 type III pantothenate kinase [Akkermansiaceae bacterium]
MHLLIDNSNTRTKLALAEGETILAWRAVIPTSELSPETLDAALEGIVFEKVTVCSVVPKAAEMMEVYFEAPLHRISHRSVLPVKINYPKPEQIGADRLANATAAVAKYGAPAIVIDFGTAVTFDVADASGAYLGGAIAPGTASLRDYLHRSTALLPSIQLTEPKSAIGKSTEEAMQVGAVIGYRGLIREILQQIKAELGGEPVIIATGGDAALIASGLEEIETLDPDLTLEGIQEIGVTNHEK